MNTTEHHAAIDVPRLDLDPFSEEVLNDPFAAYASIRDAGPVVYLDRYRCYAVARHAEVRAVLRDWQQFSSALGGIGLGDIREPGAWRPAGPIVEADPPDHTRVRGLLNRLLSPAVIRTWKEAFDREADEMVERLVEAGSFDGVKDVAEYFVYTAFPRVVGLAPTEGLHEKLSLVGELNFDGLGPRNERFLETERKVQAILPWYTKSYQRENMLPGGFGELIYQAGDAGEIDPAVCPGLLHSFLRGGMDTTVSAIGSVLEHFATKPGQWEMVRADPALARAAIEETVRLDAPITSLFRTTTRDVELAGAHIPADTKVQVFLGAANRDPRFWERPDEFDITRSTLGHVAFGFGVHTCVGQMIARMEGEAVVKAFARRASSIELAQPAVRRINNTLRSLASLPLRVQPSL